MILLFRSRAITAITRMTAISLNSLAGFRHPQQQLEQQQPALQVYRDQEIFFRMLASVLAQLRGKLRMRQQVPDLVSAAFHRMHQHAGELMHNL